MPSRAFAVAALAAAALAVEVAFLHEVVAAPLSSALRRLAPAPAARVEEHLAALEGALLEALPPLLVLREGGEIALGEGAALPLAEGPGAGRRRAGGWGR